jgi:hypothetical protein
MADPPKTTPDTGDDTDVIIGSDDHTSTIVTTTHDSLKTSTIVPPVVNAVTTEGKVDPPAPDNISIQQEI